MKSSVLTLRRPIPLARAIRWVPAGLFTPPRTLDDLALFITQSALRDVMRHLRSDPEQELLGFLLGELYECPETGARYVVVNSAFRTGHAIAESDRILIPEEEWLGVQLEVRRRRTQLVGWYHSAPFVGPHPARADLDTHRALFAEPWQCGLVIATSGDAPAGAFFRSLMGERTGGGVLIPFYELPDDDQPIPADGRKRTLIDWVNYETRGTVERDESERRPFVPSRPPTPHGAPVILSVPSAPEGDEYDKDETPAERVAEHGAGRHAEHGAAEEESRTVIPLTPLRAGDRTGDRTGAAPAPAPTPAPAPASASPNGDSARPGRERAATPPGATASPPTQQPTRQPRATPPGQPPAQPPAQPPRQPVRTPEGVPGQPPRARQPVRPPASPPPPLAGGGLVMLPSAAELEEMLAGPEPGAEQGGGLRRGVRNLLILLIVAAVGLVYLWNSGRVQLPGFLAGVPVLDNSAAPPPVLPGYSERPVGVASSNPATPSEPAPPVAESAGASLSSADSIGARPGTAAPAGSTQAGRTTLPANEAASEPAPSSDPAVQHFTTLADSLEESIRNFQDRNDDFAVHRITCDGLAVGYRSADDAFIALASAHRAARESLDSTREARYRRLVDRMGRVNEEFGGSGCPRP